MLSVKVRCSERLHDPPSPPHHQLTPRLPQTTQWLGASLRDRALLASLIEPLRVSPLSRDDPLRGGCSVTPAERRRHRVDHGLCPSCGKEAAPYYLCPDCRTKASMLRMLNTMARRGIIDKSRRGRDSLWSIEKGKDRPQIDQFRWGKYLLEMDDSDKRLRPRMGQRPIDLDETLMSIFRDAGKPLSMEEIYHAWGRLRSRRKTGTLAGDMSKIIAAQRRREGRSARRVARFEQTGASA